MPAGSLLAPEAGPPDEDLLLDGAEHDQDQAAGRKLREDAERDADPAQQLGNAEEGGETLAHADLPAPPLEVPEVVPAAVREDQPHQHPHQQQPKIGEGRQSWKHRLPPWRASAMLASQHSAVSRRARRAGSWAR